MFRGCQASIIRQFFEKLQNVVDFHVNPIQITSVKNTLAKAAFSWKVPSFAPVAA